MSDEPQGLQEAINAAREQGHAAGRAEGYSAGRADASAIFQSPEAEGRSELAAELAGDAAITPERASSLLGKSVKAEASGNYQKMLQSATPDVGPSPAPEAEAEASAEADREARAAELAAIGKSVTQQGNPFRRGAR